MTHLLFQNSLLISGIMCHKGCGVTIEGALKQCLVECKKDALLPPNAQLIIDAEPQSLGIHRLFITIESDELETKKSAHLNQLMTIAFKKSLDEIGFEVIETPVQVLTSKSNFRNWINIAVNLIAIAAISVLAVIFPPSLLLTLGLTTLSVLSTAFTAREYLITFVRNARNKNIMNMATTITLGCLLSLAHTLYHSITMPVVNGFSMMFMNFIMPVLLITLINGMDEIKRLVLNKSKSMHLNGMNTLFPQMANEYECYKSSLQEQEILAQYMHSQDEVKNQDYEGFIAALLNQDHLILERKNALKKGMIIKIKRGACFPVDCLLINGPTLVDASLLTGEPQQAKQHGDFIPAGAVNLGQVVTVYATQDCYNSTINKILFRSNRAQKKLSAPSNQTFTYLYMGLIVMGVVTALMLPWVLGIFTIPLLLQNVTGILFGICPCTLAIAHQLPKVLSIYQRANKGIVLRDERLSRESNDIHTIVFDKTGTLTTGNSEVESSEGISESLWERVYLLEKHCGAEHPLANAIIDYYDAPSKQPSMIKDINKVLFDSKSRGLSAVVQGKQIHLGNRDYLEHAGIELPSLNTDKIKQGFSPVYVAEDNLYQGVIYIKHEVRKDILVSLSRLKKEGKKLIMLTGDSLLSAQGFNQQNGAIFDPEDIHAEQTPQKKEDFMSHLMNDKAINPKGVWFVGDGLNDATCARTVSEKGGISCAMTNDTKAVFFTDIALDGSLDYLFVHNKLNRFLKKNTLQNQGVMVYSALVFLAFIVSFSIAGIAVSPIIPLLIMASTTLFVVFNSYRAQRSVTNALEKNVSWVKRWMSSDWPLALLVGSGFLLMSALLIMTIATGGLALPALVFSAGAIAAVSSLCLLAASTLAGLFVLLTTVYLFEDTLKISDDHHTPLIQSPTLHTIIPLPIERWEKSDIKPLNLEKAVVSTTSGYCTDQLRYVDQHIRHPRYDSTAFSRLHVTTSENANAKIQEMVEPQEYIAPSF
jgi:Cu+-exporting ATPase